MTSLSEMKTTRAPGAVCDALRLVDAAEAQRSGDVSAWCYTCRGLRSYRLPLPAIQLHVIPLTVAGRRVGEMRVTMREGLCDTCGALIYRVGGGREGAE